jgi:hypothetical protein
MKTHIVLLRIAGCISLLFMFFHFSFYKMFEWDNTLGCLSQVNKSIFLTYHYVSFLVTGFMGIIPIVQAGILLGSKLKYSVLSFFALFYLIRIITEFTLFGLSMPQSLIIIVMCALPMVLFSIPIFIKVYENSKPV